MDFSDILEIPPHRRDLMREIVERLVGARHVILTTHVNADGDGAGSEAAIASWLAGRGVRTTIINPSPFPSNFEFLLHRRDAVAELGSPEADRAVAEHDLALVVDTSEANRIAPLDERLDPDLTIVLDHHPAGPSVVGASGVQDPSAAAAGELVYDLLALAGDDWPPEAVQGVYVALVSDTGSFRFSNTTPRAHAIAAEMIHRGVDPERIFQKLFATFPPRRFELLREALANLSHEPDLGLSWMVVDAPTAQRLGATHEDFEGLIDHARAIQGTRVAVLFREMDGVVKISFRSNDATDVNRIAREFGGGGHVKAAGATMEGGAARAVERVLGRVRRALEGTAAEF